MAATAPARPWDRAGGGAPAAASSSTALVPQNGSSVHAVGTGAGQIGTAAGGAMYGAGNNNMLGGRYGGGLGSTMYGGGGLGGMGSMYGGGGLGGMGSMYGGGLGGMGGMGSMYGGMGGMGSMYGGMGGMGSMYGGMGGMGMMGGMGGMGMMGGMGGMMGGMGGMMQPSEWEQRGHMAFMMMSRVLESLGMLSHIVQSLFGAVLQFMASYVGLSQQYQQLNAPGGGAPDASGQAALMQRPSVIMSPDRQWVFLPPALRGGGGAVADLVDERGEPLPIQNVDDGAGGIAPAVPVSCPAAERFIVAHNAHNSRVAALVAAGGGSTGAEVESTVARLLRYVRHAAVLCLVAFLLRRALQWYSASGGSAAARAVLPPRIAPQQATLGHQHHARIHHHHDGGHVPDWNM